MMGKYMRKCKRFAEIAVMEVAHVGVRTRARALAMEAAASSATAKRRKVGGGELDFSSSLIQLTSRRGVPPENSISPATSANSGESNVLNDRCTSLISGPVPPSCCSSNASSDLAKERLKSVDLEDDCVKIETSSTSNFDNIARRETTPSNEQQAESSDLESTATPMEANCSRGSSAAEMPSETEIDAFFAAAEKDLHKQFTEKYNYDIVRDVPLQGRYEWVPLKP